MLLGSLDQARRQGTKDLQTALVALSIGGIVAQSLFRGAAGARALKDLNLSPPSVDLPKAAFIGLGVGLALFLAYETIPALTVAAAVAVVI